MAFDSVEDVQVFVKKNGEAALMAEMRSGRHNERSTRFYHEWSGAHEVKLRDENFALQWRSVEAAERSAKASEAAALSSKTSARLAAAAATISLVAILVTLAKEWGWFN